MQMYLIPVTLRNRYDSGLLSGEDHLNNYLKGVKKDEFYFHTIHAALPNREEFYATCYSKDDIGKVMERAEQELGSHSLKPMWGNPKRAPVGEVRQMFGWKY